ncbi:DDE_3 domain-containing protein [Trichonephila clavipes]|nr:DDE_3 domain-containing protein [Trichonephila clavipes]
MIGVFVQCWDGRTHPHVFKRGSVTTNRYMDEVLETYVCIFTCVVDHDFILVEDNEKSHRAHLVDEFLEREDIHRIDWPIRSPGLIPM